MSYDHQKMEMLVDTGSNGDLASAADLKVLMPTCLIPIRIVGIAAIIREVIGTGAATVELDYRPTLGSDTGRVQKAKMTLPVTGSSVGDIHYNKSFTPFVVKPGTEIVLETDGGATTTGSCDFYIEYEWAWETPENNSLMINTTE